MHGLSVGGGTIAYVEFMRLSLNINCQRTLQYHEVFFKIFMIVWIVTTTRLNLDLDELVFFSGFVGSLNKTG